MNPAPLTLRINRSLTTVLLVAVSCMALLSAITFFTLHSIIANQRSHAESFVPAKRLTAGFEREILNARIFFIYYVTIQKPGALENGWKRYHNAEATLRDMDAIVHKYPELSNLRAPVAKLQQDVANYGVALTATLNMVQGGETSGPHYDAQVKEWAARGATMVTDSAAVESLTFTSGEANTKDISQALKNGKRNILVAFSLCCLVSLVLCVMTARNLNHSVIRGIESRLDDATPSPRPLSVHPLNAGAL